MSRLAAKFLVSGWLAASPGVMAQALDVPSGTYAVDPNHAHVTFSYEHQKLSYPLLRVVDVNGEIELDADDLAESKIAIAIATDSIRSNVEFFDRELASPKFFNAARFPHITYLADSYVPGGPRHGELNGTVTIRGVTRPMSLDVTINGAIAHPVTGVPVIGVTATGSLNRSDFELDRFIPAVSDKVDVAIEIEFQRGSNDASAAAAMLARDNAGGSGRGG